jgi:hypothetical protein
MWNGFGDLPTMRRKLEVLEGHCREVSRDPGLRQSAGLTGW